MFAVVYMPQFGLQAALRHEPDLWTKAVALVDPVRSTPTVCDLTESARQAGVAAGLTPTQAMARCGQVLIRHRSPKSESSASDAGLQCAYGFSPNIEATASGVITLDLRGLMKLAGAESPALIAWAGELRTALGHQGLRARIGVAPTPSMARHAARWSEGIEVVGEPKAFIASLPVAALEPSSDVSEILYKWGVRTVGEFLALGQEAVMDRLGLEALALFAAASPSASRPLHLVRPAERFEESFEFDPAIETMEPLLFLLRRFVDQLCARLELTGFVAELLKLRLRLESGEVMERSLRIPQPTRDVEILFRTLHIYLETLRTDAAIVMVGLTIDPTQPQQKQFGLFEAALRDPHQFQETLARLTALLGSDRVGTPVRGNSHRPDVFKLVSPDFENASAVGGRRRPAALEPLALRRFRPAVKADIGTQAAPNGTDAPATILCSAAKGRLKLAMGPWRASGRWWEPGAWQREEWDLSTTSGQVIRVVKNGEGWVVEGVVD
jgi:protein ImuB